ncbi:MAG: enoyl-CoA hydratase/isomerase family protein [Candidatus Sericytochromatia bacterium]|nr:enoyl-CoA hydratase/isomerase family protein [Candidatus Sericytochromatia bacterium]
MNVTLAQEGAIAHLTLARPDKLNAMTHAMGDELSAAVQRIAQTPGVRCVLLSAEGRAFSAGGDLAFLEANLSRSESENQADMRAFYDKFLSIRDLPVPTVALMQGRATGAGLCLALACDMRLAATDAALSFNFVRLGLTPGMGGTWLLPQLVGLPTALDLALTGRTIEAGEALQLGLVQRVVPSDALASAGQALAREIASGAPQAIRQTKALLRRAAGTSLAEALDAEAAAQAIAFQGSELREGLAALRARRAPAYD